MALTPKTRLNHYEIIAPLGAIAETNLRRALQALRTQAGNSGLKGLVLDLRNNPGGLLDQAVQVADDFLDQGEIVSTRARRQEDAQRWNAKPGDIAQGLPIVVLINGGSASASEIVAGALQDHDRALIVGQSSFGKGLVQLPFELSKDSGGLVLTTGKYYTPSGRLIQRDYSNVSFYDYVLHRNGKAPDATQREVFRTTAGRPIYGGGGITPDIAVDLPLASNRTSIKWLGATFAFTAEAVNGRVKGFESFAYKGLTPNHVVGANEFVVTEKYLDAFKRFVADHPELKLTPAEVDADREVLRIDLRRELATAHFGIEASTQVANLVDPTLQRAIKELPQAERMAAAFRTARPANVATRAAN